MLGFGLAEQRHHAVMTAARSARYTAGPVRSTTASWSVAVQALKARTVQSMFNRRLNLGECLSEFTGLDLDAHAPTDDVQRGYR